MGPIIQTIITQVTDTIQQIANNSAPVTEVVFTGGGAKLDGLLDAIQEKISFTARLGTPRNIANVPPVLADASYTGAVGAIDYSSLVADPGAYHSLSNNVLVRAVDSAKRWVAEYF